MTAAPLTTDPLERRLAQGTEAVHRLRVLGGGADYDGNRPHRGIASAWRDGCAYAAIADDHEGKIRDAYEACDLDALCAAVDVAWLDVEYAEAEVEWIGGAA